MKTLSLKELSDIVEKQKRLRSDEGGITFSGGEPLLQAKAILSILAEVDIHTATETSGYSDEQTFCRLLDRMDYVMMDLKIADEQLHRKYTGVSNRPILKNLEHLRKSGKPFVLRTPLIPGVTDTVENLSALEKIVGNDKWEKLPYNPLAPAKHQRIGLKYLL